MKSKKWITYKIFSTIAVDAFSLILWAQENNSETIVETEVKTESSIVSENANVTNTQNVSQIESNATAREKPSSSTTAVSDLPSSGQIKKGNGNNNGSTVELEISEKEKVTSSVEAATNNLISIALDNVPVPDVVNMFAEISGANIIVAGNFTNLYITANLKNVDWKSALNLALGSVNLSTIEDPSGIIMVVTAEKYQEKLKQIESTKPLVTRVIVPRYLNPIDVANQIRQMNILSPRGSITTSQGVEQHKANLKSSESGAQAAEIQNPSVLTAIIITDIKEYADKVEALIQSLDRREPQVFIEARIINIAAGNSSKVGFDWDMLDKFGVQAGLRNLQWNYTDSHSIQNADNKRYYIYDNRAQADRVNKFYNVDGQQYEESTTRYEESPPGSGNWVAITEITPTRQITDSIEKGLQVSRTKTDDVADSLTEGKTATAFLTMSDVSLFLSALKTMANAELLSHPQIVVGNKVEAKIHVGERYPVLPTKRDVVQGSGGPTISYSDGPEIILDLGLTLWVIPEIDLVHDMVRMTIRPETKTKSGEVVNPQTGKVYPIVTSRDLVTRVNVPSGQTVAIGGLVDHMKRKVEKKVPLLGDIPLIGFLFRHTTDEVSKNNLIILITPTILDDRKPQTGVEMEAQMTVDKFEKSLVGPSKASSTNTPQVEAVGTNAVTPSAGLSAGGAPAIAQPSQTQPASAQASGTPSFSTPSATTTNP